MNARTLSPIAKLVTRRTSHEPAQVEVTRLNFDALDLLRGLWRSTRGGITASHVDFQLIFQ
jgi:hypothetical protein